MGRWYSFWNIVLFLIFTNQLNAKDISPVKPLVIYVKSDADDIKKFAATELQKHLYLITGVLPEIRESNKIIHLDEISFFVGIRPREKDIGVLKAEESRYIIEGQKVYLYGDDKIVKHGKNILETAIYQRNRTGTLFAVYDFLFNELGIRWPEPGDRGIIYEKQTLSQLKDHQFSWIPKYDFRIFRIAQWQWKRLVRKKIITNTEIPDLFRFSEKEINERYVEEAVWFRRMKLGMHNKPEYGHAFTHYWEEYGNEHPEWFALDSFGFRGVTWFNRRKPHYVKFCVSNTELQKQIVKNWHSGKRKNHYYNACINDGRGYCKCNKCEALNVKSSPENMTDRYIYFWNNLLNGIKVYDKDAQLIVYAYSDYRYRPVLRKILPDITIGIVPEYTDSIETIEENFLGWKESGMVNYFLRPNDFNYDVGMPLGNEKYIYDRYKIFESSYMLGVDYDRNNNLSNWDVNAIGSYILARAFSDNKSFTELENEYLETFGGAKEEISAYYKYWRSIFKKNYSTYIESNQKFKIRYIYKNMNYFYKENDFIYANVLLDSAIQQADNDLAFHKIMRMKLANKHAHLIFNAIVNKDKKSSCALYDFRKTFKEKLLISWPLLFSYENKYKITGIEKYCK